MSAQGLNTARIALVWALALAMALSSGTALAQDDPSDFVSAHNRRRTLVHVPSVQWNSSLANYAYRRASLCQYSHAPSRYGENLFWGWGKVYHAEDAIAWWVAEKAYYDCWSNSCATGRVCGHYTQVVWRRTTARIGCARVVCPASSLPGANDSVYYFVCNYDPAACGQRLRTETLSVHLKLLIQRLVISLQALMWTTSWCMLILFIVLCCTCSSGATCYGRVGWEAWDKVQQLIGTVPKR